MSEAPPRFRPLTVAPRPARIAVALIGPLLWFAAFIVLAIVADKTLAIAHGLAIAVVSFVVAIAALIPTRRRRIREEREGEPPRPDR
jgi:hypothetical protein